MKRDNRQNKYKKYNRQNTQKPRMIVDVKLKDSIKRYHALIGSLISGILFYLLLVVLYSNLGGGHFEIKIKFLIYLFILFIIIHQLFIIFVLRRIKDIKNFYKNICLTIIIFIVCVIIMIISLQFILPDSMVFTHRQCDKLFHHSFIPNSKGVEFNSAEEFETNYVINSMGFRDKEYNFKKCKHCFRILMVGDSFTEGGGVQENESFSNLIEVELNKLYNTEIEVINTGISSNSVVLEYLMLKYKLINLEPDMVVLNIDISDIMQDSAYLKEATFSSNMELMAINGCGVTEKDYKIENIFNVKFFKLLNNIADKIIIKLGIKMKTVTRYPKKDIMITNNNYLVSNIKEVNEYWDTTFIYLEQIVNITKTNNVDLIIVTYPWGHQISKDEWSEGRKAFGFEENKIYSLNPQRRIMSFCKKKDLTYLDISEKFIESKQKNYYTYDMHWNKRGHVIASEAMVPVIIENIE